MAQAVYSKTFLAVVQAAAAAVVTYTVPAGFVALLTSIDVVQFDPTKATLGFVGISLTGSSFVQLFDVELAVGAATTRKSFHWTGHVALEAAGAMNVATTGTAGGFNYYTLAGYLLTT